MSVKNKEIEIYANKMLLRFIEKGLIIPTEENSKFIIVSSYKNRLEKLSILIPENKRLLLSFDDLERKSAAFPFTTEMAYEIYQFVEDDDGLDRIYICCDDGISRSNGIACALYRYYGNTDMENIIWRSPHASPNLTVYQFMTEALGIIVTDEELQQLRNIRDNALSSAIKEQTLINREIYRYGLNSRVDMEKRKEYFSRLYALDGNSDVMWRRHGDNVCEISVGYGDLETMKLCIEIATNSMEFIWYYGITAEDVRCGGNKYEG